MARLGSLLVCSAVAATTLGCSEIRLHTVHTDTEVLSRRRSIVHGNSVRVRSRIDGTTLFLQTEQGCDLVEMEELHVVEKLESNEDLTEEFTVLGLSTAPLLTGIVMLVDAPNVYGDDRNSASYNPTGPTGAYAGGIALTAVGGIMALVPIIELLRSAAAGEERESTSNRQGAVVAADVQCDEGSRPVRSSVVLRVGANNLSTRGTDNNGHLELDLAVAIPHEVAKKAVMVQVIVAGKVVGELDIEPILDAQVEMQREQEARIWQSVERQRCAEALTDDDDACASVRGFLTRFPEGAHAPEARELLLQRERRQDKVIAEDPPEAAQPNDATTNTPQCMSTCNARCGLQKNPKPCMQACIQEVCR